MYAVIRVIPSARFKMQHANLERKTEGVPPQLHKKALAVLFSKCKTTTLLDNLNAILHSMMATTCSSCKAICTLHWTRPGATTGDGNPRTLNMKGLVMGCSTYSKPHQEEEIARRWDSVATETSSGADGELEEKSKTKEVNEWKSGEVAHVHWHKRQSFPKRMVKSIQPQGSQR